MRISLLFLFCLLYYTAAAQKYINPQGVYILEVDVEKIDDGFTGRVGSIQVKRVTQGKLVIVIYGAKGAPSYNSGSLKDTVGYVNNKAVCKYDGNDICEITIYFSEKSAKVYQQGKDHECGLGSGVYLDGIYKKTKNRVEELIHPQTGEVIIE